MYLHTVENKDMEMLFDKKLKLNVTTELYGVEGKIIKTNTIDESSQLESSTTKEHIAIKLISFSPSKYKKYNIKIRFGEVDKIINNVQKEFIIEQNYDYASFPWWGLLQRIFLIFSIVCTFISLAMGFLVSRNR